MYGAGVRGESINEALAMESSRAMNDPARATSWAYAQQIVVGITEHGDDIDELIETYSQGWPLNRMPAVNRALLLHSTEDSAGFINGLLDRIAANKQ
eukprot:NODE_20082_length_814_cov_3.551674.p2 GENE.NODE_20082_length_814_cov_3.551674~~NODE_20082_length_814_cov_3.551674.p2  ORF type:complete len:97 (-),score=11.94 NODE_20082_length_814_cov_3.551674:376-666(-)